MSPVVGRDKSFAQLCVTCLWIVSHVRGASSNPANFPSKFVQLEMEYLILSRALTTVAIEFPYSSANALGGRSAYENAVNR